MTLSQKFQAIAAQQNQDFTILTSGVAPLNVRAGADGTLTSAQPVGLEFQILTTGVPVAATIGAGGVLTTDQPLGLVYELQTIAVPLICKLGSIGTVIPALFVSGQSNSGNVDTVPGTVDARVTFTWSANGTVFNGPGAMGVQNSGGNNGHSYEWQCSSNMAAAFQSAVLVGKTWADGATCDQFCRVVGQPAWPFLQRTIDNFARQCVTAGLTQVAFIWDQGSSEALLVNAALTPQLTVNTQSVFASIRALFKAYGIGRVRFYVMQQNIHFIGLSGIDTGQLNSVRAQEAAIVAGDPDAVLLNCDDITMASGYHYAAGQTNTIGSRFAALIAADFTAVQPAFVTPPTVEQILGSTLLQDLDSRAGIAVATGQPVPLWLDQSSHGANGQAIGTARPTYIANAQGLIPGVQGNGTTNLLQIVPGTMTLPQPSVTPTWSWDIVRIDQYTNGDRIWGGVPASPAVMQFGGGTFIQAYNGSFSGSSQATVGKFQRIESLFSNSNAAHVETPTGVTTGDYLKVHENAVGGINLGNTALSDIELFGGGATFSHTTYLKRVTANALPTKAMLDQMCGYYTANYGTECGVT